MNISHFISELLQEHDYVIVPGFGAFVSTYQPARILPGNQTVLPPSRVLSFNSHLKNNDGLLINELATRLKIPQAEAWQQTEQFRDDLQYRLDNGEAVWLEELGTLSRSGSGYLFEPAAASMLSPDLFGLESVLLEALPQAAPQPAGSAASAASPAAGRPTVKKIPFVWLAAAGVLIIAALIFFINQKPQPAPEMAPAVVSADSTQVAPVAPADSMATDSVSAKEEVAEPQSAQPAEKRYYLIGGSFKSKENADEYLEKATRKGYHPIYLGQIGNFHVVALAAFTSEKKAVQAKDSVLKLDPQSGIWVFEPRQPE